MTFLSGFAEGYLTERKRKIEREENLFDQSFQYRMKYLTDQKDKRNTKKLKEEKLGKDAQMLAEQLGDPSAAATFYKELSADVPTTTIQERIAKGHYKKNDKYVQPTQTVKVPGAVSMERPDSQFPQDKKMDDYINRIDPDLIAPVEMEDDGNTTTSDEASNPYLFKPKNEIEVGDYDQAQYELLKAEENKDPAAITEARTKLRAHEIALTRKAQIQAKAEGKNAKTYIYKDPKTGKMTSTFTGELRDGTLWNTTVPTVDGYGNTGKIVTAEDLGQIQEITPEAFEAMEKLEYEFGKQSATIHEGQANFVGALNTSQKMISLLDETPEVTTYTASGVELVRDLTEEARVAYGVVFGQENEIKDKIKSGDLTGVEKMIADYEQGVESLIETSAKNNGIMGAGNQRLASNKAIYDSLRNLITFQMAAANGVSGAKMSDKDFDKFWQMIGGDKKDPRDVIRALQNTSQVVLTTLDTHRSQINSHPAIKGFATRYGFDPGVGIPRMEDMLVEMGREDLIPTLRSVTGKQEMEKAIAAEGATQNAIVPMDENQPVGPQEGDTIDGYQFLGGNPADQKNWKKVN